MGAEQRMVRCQILASFNFSKDKKIVPWIGEQLYIEMLFRQFILLFPNSGDKLQRSWKAKGEICPLI